MPDFDAKVENKEGEDEGPHQRGHGRNEMGHGEMGHEMDRIEEEGVKNLGRGDDRGESQGEREQMEREGREHEGGRPEPEGENFVEKGGPPPADNVPEEPHGELQQQPQEQQEVQAPEEASNMANVGEMTDAGPKGIQKMEQQVEADGKSVVQASDPVSDPMAGVMSGLGGSSEEGFNKKVGAEPSPEEDPNNIDPNVVSQLQTA